MHDHGYHNTLQREYTTYHSYAGTHIVVLVVYRFSPSVVFCKVGHTATQTMSGTCMWAVASLTACSGKSCHTLAFARLTIAQAAVGALHSSVGSVYGGCFIAPSEPSRACSLGAISSSPPGPAITPACGIEIITLDVNKYGMQAIRRRSLVFYISKVAGRPHPATLPGTALCTMERTAITPKNDRQWCESYRLNGLQSPCPLQRFVHIDCTFGDASNTKTRDAPKQARTGRRPRWADVVSGDDSGDANVRESMVAIWNTP